MISKQVDASQGGDGSNLFDDDGQMKHEVNFCAPSRVKNLLDPPNRDVGIHFSLYITKRGTNIKVSFSSYHHLKFKNQSNFQNTVFLFVIIHSMIDFKILT